MEKEGKEIQISINLSTDGIIESIFKSIDDYFGINTVLLDYHVKAVTETKKSMANTFVKVSVNDKVLTGHAVHIDTIVSSCEAYISVINSFLLYYKKI